MSAYGTELNHLSRLAPDERVAALAREQYGVASRRQLRACGLTETAVTRRVQAGRLVRLHRGVYAVGHAVLRAEGHRLAAVLAAGRLAALSHGGATEHWDLRRDGALRYTVTVPRGAGTGPSTVIVRRAPLPAADVTVHRGIPVTTVARTILDVAAGASVDTVAGLLDRAAHLDLYDQRALDAQLAAGRPGTAVLRRAIAELHPESHRTRSDLERLAGRLAREHGLPRPSVNAWLAEQRNEVDLLWPTARVAVELDGWRWHAGRRSFEHDREQTADLQAAGYTVLRFTWRQVDGRPAWVAGHIRRALERAI